MTLPLSIIPKGKSHVEIVDSGGKWVASVALDKNDPERAQRVLEALSKVPA